VIDEPTSMSRNLPEWVSLGLALALDICGQIGSFASRERHIRHLWMWIEQERAVPAGIHRDRTSGAASIRVTRCERGPRVRVIGWASGRVRSGVGVWIGMGMRAYPAARPSATIIAEGSRDRSFVAEGVGFLSGLFGSDFTELNPCWTTKPAPDEQRITDVGPCRMLSRVLSCRAFHPDQHRPFETGLQQPQGIPFDR
jgi:hypothetical protein